MFVADPFADAEGGLKSEDCYIHIRIQQRNGRKTLTTVQGINSEKYDLKKIVKHCKKARLAPYLESKTFMLSQGLALRTFPFFPGQIKIEQGQVMC